MLEIRVGFGFQRSAGFVQQRGAEIDVVGVLQCLLLVMQWLMLALL